MVSDVERVFVYGTLRPPRPDAPAEDTHFYQQIAPYVHAATVARLPNAELYNVGAFPAARPGRGVVHGDLLVVAPIALTIMDRIEGHPGFFHRCQVSVRTGAGRTEAWTYWGPEEMVEGKPRIDGGDWLGRKRKGNDREAEEEG